MARENRGKFCGKLNVWGVGFAVTVLVMSMMMGRAQRRGGARESMGIQKAGEEAPRVALTFDDGPDSCYTPLMLEGLREREVVATFFLQGQCLAGNEEVVREMQEDGHLIGNHTFHHVQLTKVSEKTAEEEIIKTSNAIYEITGVYPTYIRPPFGSWKEGLDLAVTMIPVLWTVDSRDWESQNTEAIRRAVLPKVKDGSIILMHDGYRTSVEAAMQIVDQLKEEGYRFVTVNQLVEE